MPYRPPFKFGERVNELATSLRDSEAAAEEGVKDEHLRKAMVTACDLLESIDLPELQSEIERVFRQADASDPRWYEVMLGNSEEALDHFEFFLRNVEKAIFMAAGVNEEASQRTLNYSVI